MSSAAEQGPVADALARFAGGQHCAQAVFGAHAERLGLPAETAVKVATMFGAGVARTGQMCGACSGGLMALGLGMPDGGQRRPYELAREFMQRFAERQGSTNCRDLLGHEISSAEGLQAVIDLGLKETVCAPAVAAAAALVLELLAEG